MSALSLAHAASKITFTKASKMAVWGANNHWHFEQELKPKSCTGYTGRAGRTCNPAAMKGYPKVPKLDIGTEIKTSRIVSIGLAMSTDASAESGTNGNHSMSTNRFPEPRPLSGFQSLLAVEC